MHAIARAALLALIFPSPVLAVADAALLAQIFRPSVLASIGESRIALTLIRATTSVVERVCDDGQLDARRMYRLCDESAPPIGRNYNDEGAFE